MEHQDWNSITFNTKIYESEKIKRNQKETI